MYTDITEPFALNKLVNDKLRHGASVWSLNLVFHQCLEFCVRLRRERVLVDFSEFSV